MHHYDPPHITHYDPSHITHHDPRTSLITTCRTSRRLSSYSLAKANVKIVMQTLNMILKPNKIMIALESIARHKRAHEFLNFRVPSSVICPLIQPTLLRIVQDGVQVTIEIICGLELLWRFGLEPCW